LYAIFGELMDSFRKTVLLTGPSEFVVVAIFHDFVSREEFDISVATRKLPAFASTTHETVLFSGLGAEQCWAPALEGVDLVVHSAARVHIMKERACGSRQVDITKKRNLLGWLPAVKLGDALIKSANPFQGTSTR
jgi:hypothetical protein